MNERAHVEYFDWLRIIAALSVILLLTVLFLVFTARMNRRLAHAKRAAEASNRFS